MKAEGHKVAGPDADMQSSGGLPANQLPPLDSLSPQPLSHNLRPGARPMATLNQPLQVHGQFGEYPYSNEFQQNFNGGFGPFPNNHLARYVGESNGGSMHPWFTQGSGDFLSAQYSISRPAESYERTPVVPQHTQHNAPADSRYIQPTSQPLRRVTQQSVLAGKRRNTLPAIPLAPAQRPPQISFAQLPPRPQVARKSAQQVMFGIESPQVHLSENDRLYVEFIKQEMMSTENAEDNEGMKDTWSKIVRGKPHKLEQAALLILALFDVSRQTDDSLTEKKPITHYESWQQRFEALGKTLRTQKTVCKHIVEEPYILQVIDDPVGATKRVTNNRRVNDQKAKAINLGRNKMGFEGNGKGAPLKRIPPRSASLDLGQPFTPNTNANAPTESEESSLSPKTRRPNRRAAVKRQYKGCDQEDDDPDWDPTGHLDSSPQKRTRRNATRSTRGRSSQPALQVDTNVTAVASESSNSNNPSTFSTTQDTLPRHGLAMIHTPTHQHTLSNGSYFTPGIASDHASPSLMPPAMRDGIWDNNSLTTYGHPQQHYTYPAYLGPTTPDNEYSYHNNETGSCNGADQHEPFFHLGDPENVTNLVGIGDDLS